MGERQRGKARNEVSQSPVAPEICQAVHLVQGRLALFRIDQARGVAQQVDHLHGPLLGLKQQRVLAGRRIDLLDADRFVLEHRQVVGDGRGQIELTFLDQHHCRHAGHGLCHRRDPEDCVRRQRNLSRTVIGADRLEIGEPAVAGDGDHGARQRAGIHSRLVPRCDPVQAFG